MAPPTPTPSPRTIPHSSGGRQVPNLNRVFGMVVEEMAQARFIARKSTTVTTSVGALTIPHPDSRSSLITQLAARSGSRYHTVRSVLDGTQSANTSMIFRLAQALDVTPYHLMYAVSKAIADIDAAEVQHTVDAFQAGDITLNNPS